MADEPINYTKEAFLHPWNLAFLLVAMLTVLFTIGVPVVPELVLTFVAALELLYLGIMPRQERFQRAVRARQAQERHKVPSEKEIFRQLSKASQKRYIRFRNLEKAVRENYERFSYASQGILAAHVKKIDDLLDSYLNLLWQRERYERFTLEATEDKVVQAIEQLRREMKDDPPRVRQIKQKRLDILEKRLDRFKKADENLAVIEAQLETIEDVTKYIHEQSLTMRNPEEVSFQLDTLIAEVEETQAAVTEIEEVFTAPGSLLSDIDTYDPEPESESEVARRGRLRT
jgi:vacuolar-type H+-ATPase subunit I/STV1